MQGNFLITNDGRLAILDHGLITEIKEEQRIALVLYVAHLLGKGKHVASIRSCHWFPVVMNF